MLSIAVLSETQVSNVCDLPSRDMENVIPNIPAAVSTTPMIKLKIISSTPKSSIRNEEDHETDKTDEADEQMSPEEIQQVMKEEDFFGDEDEFEEENEEGWIIDPTMSNKQFSTRIGDKTEEWVVALLLDSKQYKSVIRVGQLGGNSDILITHFNDDFNYIQVKTLVDEGDDNYKAQCMNYPDNMLIVLVNKKRDRFGLCFAKLLNDKSIQKLKLSFGYSESIYRNNMYYDKMLLLKDMISAIPHSTKINKLAPGAQKELESQERFIKYCFERGHVYERNTTNGNAVDGFLDGKWRIQMKFVSQYDTTVTMLTGRKHGPYNENDFDACVIEVGGDRRDETKYRNNFLFLPTYTLAERNIVKTKNGAGQGFIHASRPDNRRNWQNRFWNNFEVLTANPEKYRTIYPEPKSREDITDGYLNSLYQITQIRKLLVIAKLDRNNKGPFGKCNLKDKDFENTLLRIRRILFPDIYPDPMKKPQSKEEITQFYLENVKTVGEMRRVVSLSGLDFNNGGSIRIYSINSQNLAETKLFVMNELFD